MDVTPKLQRKSSLSLSSRLKHKRHSASPQTRLKTSTSNSAINSRELNANFEALQRSPSVISLCSDGGIESTPPHKKMIMNLDDSLEYSPKVFDTSFSPTCLLSQTLAIESPEVGWKWNRRSSEAECSKFEVDDNSVRTPDSTYTADSSFTSVVSSSTGLVSNVGDTYNQRLSYNRHREHQRKIYEQKLRRIEMYRAEEKLKERCAKLQEQLKSAGSQKAERTVNQSDVQENNTKNGNATSCHSISLSNVDIKTTTKTSVSYRSPKVVISPEKSENAEMMMDFFNDSDSDGLLIAATQEIESKMNVKTQPALINTKSTSTQSTISSECISLQQANTAPVTTNTPPKTVTPPTTQSSAISSNKEKRSSFYMKFLEDDCPDDWFVSLDDVILQATQTKKARTPLQRYKSMPASTNPKVSSPVKDGNDNCLIDSDINASRQNVLNSGDSIVSSSLSRMKRHSSTHILSPASSHYKSRRQL